MVFPSVFFFRLPALLLRALRLSGPMNVQCDDDSDDARATALTALTARAERRADGRKKYAVMEENCMWASNVLTRTQLKWKLNCTPSSLIFIAIKTKKKPGNLHRRPETKEERLAVHKRESAHTNAPNEGRRAKGNWRRRKHDAREHDRKVFFFVFHISFPFCWTINPFTIATRFFLFVRTILGSAVATAASFSPSFHSFVLGSSSFTLPLLSFEALTGSTVSLALPGSKQKV